MNTITERSFQNHFNSRNINLNQAEDKDKLPSINSQISRTINTEFGNRLKRNRKAKRIIILPKTTK